jgi:hypothetical protein
MNLICTLVANVRPVLASSSYLHTSDGNDEWREATEFSNKMAYTWNHKVMQKIPAKIGYFVVGRSNITDGLNF